MNLIKLATIKSKLAASYILLIFLTIILTVIAITSMHSSQSVAVEKIEQLNQRYDRTRLSTTAMYDMNEVARKLSSTRSVTNNSDVNSAINELKNRVDALQTARFPTEITAIKKSTSDYITIFNDVFYPAIKSGDIDLANSVYVSNLSYYYAEFQKNMAEVNAKQILETKSAMTELTDNKTTIFIILCTIVEVIIALIIATILPKSILTTIKTIGKDISVFAKGNFVVKFATDRKDEFNHLSVDLENLRHELHKDMFKVVDASNRIGKVIDELSDTSEQINATADENQKRALTVAAASEEMVLTTSEIAKNCERATTAAQESAASTTSGVQKIQDVIDMIERQVIKSKEDALLVQNLSVQVQKIETIVNTIDDIASQTNLLALNAAIEAARAGEAGKGFAVVADEVRALASRTTASTNEITNMVSKIQSDAAIADEAIQQSVVVMDDISTHSNEIESILDNVKGMVNEVSVQITQIATAAEQQTVATQEISTNMKSITDGSRHLNDSITLINGDIKDSNDLVVELLNMVSKFTV